MRPGRAPKSMRNPIARPQKPFYSIDICPRLGTVRRSASERDGRALRQRICTQEADAWRESSGSDQEVMSRESQEAGGQKKGRRSRLQELMFETPPLEINGLRIAGSCASGIYERQPSCNLTVASSRKAAGLFSAPSPGRGFLGTRVPKNPFPHQWKFLTHGITSGLLSRQAPCHAHHGSKKVTFFNSFVNNEMEYL